MVRALRTAVDTVLTPHQRTVFVTIVLDHVPLDVVVDRTGSNRNALYKTLFDARRKLRTHLEAVGHLPPSVPAAVPAPRRASGGRARATVSARRRRQFSDCRPSAASSS